MHLKTLTLRGFKSFASATTLSFEPGVTCVVGPNGSGKSNVVDALSWVMGEQGAKTLRGGKMEDVIFAGTSGRPPLGRAEVSLTIDNTDGALPIDYSEVTITRTLFRTGGSEYAINGAQCRLLDIQDLLSDTGIGRQQHVIVGQGQLDAVLNARPEDRRAVIEEAAGILKFRKRRERAERRLEATEGNLLRLNDLLREVRRQLTPLQRQADAARQQAAAAHERAQSLDAMLRDLQARPSDRGMVVTLGDVLFDSGSAELRAGGLRVIDRLADFMREYPQRRVSIEGFTDSVGNDSANQALSEERASAVRSALVDRGIDPARVVARGFGESYPVASNGSGIGRQMNRRVEIVISDENGMIGSRGGPPLASAGRVR